MVTITTTLTIMILVVVVVVVVIVMTMTKLVGRILQVIIRERPRRRKAKTTAPKIIVNPKP